MELVEIDARDSIHIDIVFILKATTRNRGNNMHFQEHAQLWSGSST